MVRAYYIFSMVYVIVTMIAPCIHTSLSFKGESPPPIDSLPDEIMMNIFSRMALFDVRQTSSRVNKRWRNIVFSEGLKPTKLTLNYDSAGSNDCLMVLDKNSQMIPNPELSFNKIRILEINAEGDFNSYKDLFSFAKQNDVKFDQLEYLKITVEWTSSNNEAVNGLAELLGKAGMLKKFELKWTDDVRIGERNADSGNYYVKFWRSLRKSGVKAIKFKTFDLYYYHEGPDGRTRQRFDFDFHSYVFGNEFAFLKKLRKITLKIPPNLGTYNFLRKSLVESENTLEELNMDFYYFVNWMKEDWLGVLLLEISRCKNLKKIKMNFPIVKLSEYKYKQYYAGFPLKHVWKKIQDFLLRSMGQNLFFELKTSISFISQDGNLQIYDPDLRTNTNYVGLKGLSLHDDFNPVNKSIKFIRYKEELEFLIIENPKLEKLKIVNEFYNAKMRTVRQLFKVASKFKKLKELSIYYRQNHASFKDIYKTLIDSLHYDFHSVNIFTIGVTSSKYLRACDYAEKELREEKDKNNYLRKMREMYVGSDNVLNDSEIQEMKDKLPSFNVKFSLHSKHSKDDSHLLTFKRIFL